MPTAAEATYARLQRKLKVEQSRLAQIMARIATQQKSIQAAAHRAGAFVRNRYLGDPLIARLLVKHGGLNPRNLARLALATGKQHVRPMMNVGRNVKTQQNTSITNAKRRYNTWYNSLTENQRKQLAQNYNRNTGGVYYHNLNIIRNMNALNNNGFTKQFIHLPLWYAVQNAVTVPHVRNLKNAIWQRNRLPATWGENNFPHSGSYNNYRGFRSLRRRTGKNYVLNTYK